MDPSSKEKDCPQCEKYLPLEDFAVDKNSPDGHYYLCRECLSQRRKKQRAEKKSGGGVSDADIENLIKDLSGGEVSIDKKFFLKQILKLFLGAERESTKLRCLELAANISGFKGQEEMTDEAALVASLMDLKDYKGVDKQDE